MSAGDPFDLGDLFGAFFGRGSEPARRGADLFVELPLSLEELDAGCRRTLTIQRSAPCAACAGRGALAGSPATRCATCDGNGRLRRMHGAIMMEQLCTECDGIGRTGMRCPECNGYGTELASEPVEVTIPAGARHGKALRLDGKGHAVRNGTPGCVYVLIHERKHPRLSRRGDDLHVDVAIAPGDASARVPLLRGEHQLAVPAGERELVLRGHGMQILGAPPTPPPPLGDAGATPYRAPDCSGRGDLVVHLRVEKRGLGAWMKRMLR